MWKSNRGRENGNGSGIIELRWEEMIGFMFQKERSEMRMYGRRASSLPIPHPPPKVSREYCSLKEYNHRDVL